MAETAAHTILCKLLKLVNRQKLYASLSNDLLCACLLHIKMDDPDRTTNSLLAPLLSKEGVIIYLVTIFFFWWRVTGRHKEDTACLVIINISKWTKKLKLNDYLNVNHSFFVVLPYILSHLFVFIPETNLFEPLRYQIHLYCNYDILKTVKTDLQTSFMGGSTHKQPQSH